MQIIEVVNKKDWQLFHKVVHRVYKEDGNWIAHVENDINDVFNPEKNKAYLNGDAKCFVLLDDQQKPAARIMACVDHERNKKLPFPVGGIGFFECIQKEEYAFALFEKASSYLQGKGLMAIDGPINFGEREKFWGLMVKGFEEPPLYQENYNPKYYRAFFEAWGFRPYEQILTLFTKITDIPIPRFQRLAERLYKNNPYSVRPPDMGNMLAAAEDFNKIYNEAFAVFEHFKPLEIDQTLKIFKSLKPIVDPKLIAFAYYEDRPIAFCVFIPEINPFLKHAKGNMNWWNILRFFYRFKTAKQKDLKGIAFGVIPEFQKKGILSIIVDYLWKSYDPNVADKYHAIHLTTIRAHNEIMVKSTSNLSTSPNRIHQTYRKLLNPDLPFEPFEMPYLVEG